MKSVKVTYLAVLLGLACVGLALVASAPGQPAATPGPSAASSATPASPAPLSVPGDAAAPSTGTPVDTRPVAPSASPGVSRPVVPSPAAVEVLPSDAARALYQLQHAVGADTGRFSPYNSNRGLPVATNALPHVDPEMAKWMHEAGKAEAEQGQLLATYAKTTDPKEREKIKAELSKVLEAQFDLQQQQREREVAEIEARVKKLREMITNRNAAKQTIVSSRRDQLLNELDGMGWVSPTGAGPGAARRLSSSQYGTRVTGPEGTRPSFGLAPLEPDLPAPRPAVPVPATTPRR